MNGFPPDALTRDAFLGGLLQLWQPKTGYRAGIDPILLAASVPAQAGESVLDLGCGAGAAGLCLWARVPGVSVTGLELQPAYAALARANARDNGAAFEVVEGDVAGGGKALGGRNFHHVIANPPYYRAGAHTAAADPGRSTALGERVPLELWIDTAARRLRPKGWLHVIQRADRLPDLLAACTGRLGSPEVLPVSARPGRAPELVLLRARKGGRAAFRLHAPLVLHLDDRHLGNGKNYRPEIAAVQRGTAALDWPNP